MQPLDLSSNKWSESSFRWFDKNLIDATQTDESVQRFWRLIALCHTVMPEYKNDTLVYQAQSPDEAALVGAARNFGYVFKSRTPKSITIEVNGVEETYELMCIMDFNNVRKRMSVLLRKDGKLTLFCKGADTMIFERLNKEKDAQLLETTQVIILWLC
jgi:magnesium-transporting ATPase (P-type)